MLATFAGWVGWVMMMRWVSKLVETGTEGEARCMDIMTLVRSLGCRAARKS